MIDPKEPYEWPCADDNPENHGYGYYGWEPEEVDEEIPEELDSESNP
jgi:hypothetical protein